MLLQQYSSLVNDVAVPQYISQNIVYEQPWTRGYRKKKERFGLRSFIALNMHALFEANSLYFSKQVSNKD